MIWRAVVAALVKIGVVVTAVLASWFGGRKSAATDIKHQQTKQKLDTAVRAKEVESEVEALDSDTLKRRARVWVRSGPKH